MPQIVHTLVSFPVTMVTFLFPSNLSDTVSELSECCQVRHDYLFCLKITGKHCLALSTLTTTTENRNLHFRNV